MARAVVLALAFSIVMAASGSAAKTKPLTFQRAGGAPIAFHGTRYVWCGRWEPDVAERAVHVMLVPRRRRGSFWLLSGVLRDLRREPRVRFPVGFVWNRPKGAQIFAYDAMTKNEASSETEEARGTIAFSSLTCEKGKTVSFTVNGVLGSELSDRANIRVSGSFRGAVGRPPPGRR